MMPDILRRSMQAAHRQFRAFCEPAATAFADSFRASAIYTVMMLC
jgi:hypothetical protein